MALRQSGDKPLSGPMIVYPATLSNMGMFSASPLFADADTEITSKGYVI